MAVMWCVLAHFVLVSVPAPFPSPFRLKPRLATPICTFYTAVPSLRDIDPSPAAQSRLSKSQATQWGPLPKRESWVGYRVLRTDLLACRFSPNSRWDGEDHLVCVCTYCAGRRK